MGKKNKASAKPVQDAQIPAEVNDQLTTLKEQGNKFFGLTQYAKALECYDKGIKLAPEAGDKADFHVKKSACLFKLQKFKDAVKECNFALEAQPTFVNALKRRASAYEQQGLFKQALTDIAAVNKTDAATAETRDAEKRLRDTMSARSKPVSSTGAVAARANPRTTPRPSSGLVFTAKCQFKDENRLVHMPANVSYADLLAQVKAKFPESGNIVLRYVDREGDLVTITQRNDIQKALGELIQSVGGVNTPAKVASLPSLKIQVVEVADAAEVPRPPPDEELERQQLFTQQIQALRKLAQQEEKNNAQQQQQQRQAPPAQPSETYEMDEWLSDLVDLFAQITNIDPFRPDQMQAFGMEEMQQALKTALKAPEAEPILLKAGDKFLESACGNLNQVGNTHMYIATRALEDAVTAGAISKAVMDKVSSEHQQAESWYNKALALKADYWETHSSLAALSFDKAKGQAKIIGKPLTQEQQDQIAALEKESPEKAHALLNDLTSASLREALKSVDKKGLDAVKPLFDQACKHFATALEHATAATEAAKKHQEEKEKKKQEDGKEAQAEPEALPGSSPKDHVEVMYGNILYEWSQYLGHVGDEWKPMLEDAILHFKAAGCPDADINGVLKNHLMADQLDLPADEPAVAVEEPKAPEEKKPEAKGLPSLAVKKKGGK